MTSYTHQPMFQRTCNPTLIPRSKVILASFPDHITSCLNNLAAFPSFTVPCIRHAARPSHCPVFDRLQYAYMEEGVVHFIPLMFTPFLLCQSYLSHVTPTALNQAGRHMEDSIVASYTALLLGILAKHNPVRVSQLIL